MYSLEASIIIPVKNLEKEISEIILKLSENFKEIKTEFIIVDMGSSDLTVLSSFKALNKHNCKGFVIRNGQCSVSQALNTGIFKATFENIAFIFPYSLRYDFLRDNLLVMKDYKYDFVFCKTNINDSCEDSIIGKKDGVDLLSDFITGKINVDISTCVFRKDFIINNNIHFIDNLNYDCLEYFVMKSMLYAHNIGFSRCISTVDYELSVEMNCYNMLSNFCFDRVEADIKIYYELTRLYSDKKHINKLFLHRKIPQTIIECIDIKLKDGVSYSSIKNEIKLRDYDKYLTVSGVLNSRLKKKIRVWKLFPWLYDCKI